VIFFYKFDLFDNQRFQDSLEHEYELLNLIEAKDFEEACDHFDSKIDSFKSIIQDPTLNEYNSKLPSFLRAFTCSSIYCKICNILLVFLSSYLFLVLNLN
jgi:c-di-AMP phosphodiesterase-like protein